MHRQGIGGGGPRPPLLMDDALRRVRDEGRGEDAQPRKEREGILNWWKRGSTDSFLEGLSSAVQWSAALQGASGASPASGR